MNLDARVDPAAGRAFFRGASLFVCALAPPQPGKPERSALLAFAVDSGADVDAFAEALEFARHVGGRHYAIVVERVALGTDTWPPHEPPHATSYSVERDGFVVFAPSVDAWVTMPPARPHHLVQLVAAMPGGAETAARAALAELGTCGLAGRVRAVLHCGSGAEIDAVVCGPEGLRGGYFTQAENLVRDVPSGPLRADESTARQVANADSVPSHEPLTASVPSSTRRVDRSALLNDALAAFVTPPVHGQRLETFLHDHNSAADAAEIRPLLDAVVSSATDYLWAQQPGVTWSDAFERQFYQHLVSRHAWLTPPGFSSLLRYAKWLCWHEGLNA